MTVPTPYKKDGVENKKLVVYLFFLFILNWLCGSYNEILLGFVVKFSKIPQCTKRGTDPPGVGAVQMAMRQDIRIIPRFSVVGHYPVYQVGGPQGFKCFVYGGQ